VSTTARAADNPVSSKSRVTFRRPSRCLRTIVPNRKTNSVEVRIRGESSREVKISATIRTQADSHEQAQVSPDKVQIEVQQTAQGIEVRTQYPEDTRNWFGRKNASYLLIMTSHAFRCAAPGEKQFSAT